MFGAETRSEGSSTSTRSRRDQGRIGFPAPSRAGTIEEETRLTLENVRILLDTAGSGFEHVVRCGVWLADLNDFAGMNSVYRSFFPEPRPARATVGAELIVGKVEIDCIALVP
jgi:2-iminobutanoate/2-iminopropanoate deaminase